MEIVHNILIIKIISFCYLFTGCVSSPCKNGGICKDDKHFRSYTCSCLKGYHGVDCELMDDITLYCDLELGENNCFLKQDVTDDSQWIRHQGGTPTSKTGPNSAAGIGKYYFYINSNQGNFQIARLYSTEILVSRKRCLKFYYYMYGRTMGSLEVKTNTKSLFLRRGHQLNKWHYAVVPVDSEEDLQIFFVGTVGPGCKSDIAIDDIILEPRACGCDSSPCKNGGTCHDKNGVISYMCHCKPGFCGSECDIVGKVELRCTLEDNDGDCFLIQDQSESQNWMKHSGSTPTPYTGPSGAFGDGTYYYYMESTYIHVGAVAMLRTTSTFKDTKRCLELHYFMFGSGLGKLKVKANGVTVFSVSRNRGQQWLTTFIEMPKPLLNITIEGVKGTSSKSDIGVDDIILHPHSCDKTKKRKLVSQKLYG